MKNIFSNLKNQKKISSFEIYSDFVFVSMSFDNCNSKELRDKALSISLIIVGCFYIKNSLKSIKEAV